MSEDRETWEKALERGFRATEDMSDALMGRGQGDLDTIEDVLATLRATIEELTTERDAALSSLGWGEVTVDCLQSMTCPLAMSDEVCAAFRQAHKTETEGSEG